jgi:hypothetical protein
VVLLTLNNALFDDEKFVALASSPVVELIILNFAREEV